MMKAYNLKEPLRTMFTLLAALVVLLTALAVRAQDNMPAQNGYYVASDSGGTQQVYQILLDGQSVSRQITHAESDIITFGVAYDGLSIAYISAGQLWLQPIHVEEPEALAPVNASQFFSSPVFSQDGQYIAYADSGVWLFDLGARESRQLLINVPLEKMAANANEFRICQPVMFVLGEDGKAAKLTVDVGIWEWQTAGVYDLATGELQELKGQLHTRLLPLSDGRVLLYGNSGVAGEPALHIADSLEDINTHAEVIDFYSLTDATLFAEQAVEIKPGVVRIFGSAIGATLPDAANVFHFDYDLATGEASSVTLVSLSTGGESAYTIPGRLSPDGNFVPVYLSALFTDFGSIYGEFELLDLSTGETTAAQFPETVGVFRWKE